MLFLIVHILIKETEEYYYIVNISSKPFQSLENIDISALLNKCKAMHSSDMQHCKVIQTNKLFKQFEMEVLRCTGW